MWPFRKKTVLPQCDDRLSHIAFIMDGNGRWAERRGLPREAGHRAGAENFRRVVRLCGDAGIRTVTVYAFSTENWKRPQKEVEELMRLLSRYLDEVLEKIGQEQVTLRFLGDPAPLDPALREKIRRAEQATAGQDRVVNVALNYGGRDEIVHAVNALLSQGKRHVTEVDISRNLYTAAQRDPDLVVRTGGDIRTSNFLMWQSAYAEYYFTDVLWPDLDADVLAAAIREFYSRKRRYGGL